MTNASDLKRSPEIREVLKRDMARIISPVMGKLIHSGNIAEHILSGLEELGWHGVKEEPVVGDIMGRKSV